MRPVRKPQEAAQSPASGEHGATPEHGPRAPEGSSAASPSDEGSEATGSERPKHEVGTDASSAHIA